MITLHLIFEEKWKHKFIFDAIKIILWLLRITINICWKLNTVYFTWYNAANTFCPKFITDLSWSIKCYLIIKKINFLLVFFSLRKKIYDIYWTAPTYHKCHQGFCYLLSRHVRLRPYLLFYYDRAMKWNFIIIFTES